MAHFIWRYLSFSNEYDKSSKQFGFSFAHDAPKIWNDLPEDIHSATSLF